MRVIEKHTRRCVLDRLEYATGFRRRLLGLMGRSSMPEGYGLYFPRCSCIHTCFMGFSIDILYIDRNWKVLKTVRGLRPWRVSMCRRAEGVIEIAAGGADRHDLAAGTGLQVVDSEEDRT